MKTLIVYFSRTGRTRRLAERLGIALGATVCPLVEPRSRLGRGQPLCSWVDAVLGRPAAIRPLPVDVADFDLVLIGTPVWARHVASPVRSFARRHGAAVQRCAFFCTVGGAGAEAAFSELERLLQRAPEATLALGDADNDGEDADTRTVAFVRALRGAAARSV